MARNAGKICAYCGKHVLTGEEDPEHALPLAINARFKTHTVCNPCNEWAGTNIDQPWLDDLFVRGLRFQHQIPDRYGKTLPRDPLLEGMTDDGRRVRLGADGKPELLNSPINFNEETGEFEISAPDQETLDRMIDRVLKRAGKTRDEVEFGEPRSISDRPGVNVRDKLSAGCWERMAAKATLALVADAQPESWRQSESADLLRERMRDLDQPWQEVELLSPESFHAFAPPPASAIVVTDMGGAPASHVTLLGQFRIAIPLAADLSGFDRAWVSDPHDPDRSATGPLARVVGERQGLIEPEPGSRSS